ncbi:hypothetical protein B0H11DRAFT_1913638 [Mycena galericulata]|nr:hypothetical protein B0H11DRAFT_1913638 [Mycena galericulata]
MGAYTQLWGATVATPGQINGQGKVGKADKRTMNAKMEEEQGPRWKLKFLLLCFNHCVQAAPRQTPSELRSHTLEVCRGAETGIRSSLNDITGGQWAAFGNPCRRRMSGSISEYYYSGHRSAYLEVCRGLSPHLGKPSAAGPFERSEFGRRPNRQNPARYPAAKNTIKCAWRMSMAATPSRVDVVDDGERDSLRVENLQFVYIPGLALPPDTTYKPYREIFLDFD